MNENEFGEYLIQWRKERNIPQQKLGEIIGVGVTTIVRYERGYYIPPTSRQEEIKNILAVYDAGSTCDASELLNEIATREIERVKRRTEENRLLLPLLRKLGYEITMEDELLCINTPSGEQLNFSYGELMDKLEDVKKAMHATMKSMFEVYPVK